MPPSRQPVNGRFAALEAALPAGLENSLARSTPLFYPAARPRPDAYESPA